MAETDRQADEYKTPRRPVLRAKDIIPGAASPAGNDEGVSNTDIPRFDLAEDIMAEQRRLTAVRRKGPGSPELANLPPSPRLPMAISPSQSIHSFSGGFNYISDPIIADIVARDIERFCGGFRA
ncbi:MAG: hypothetical protein ABSG97_01995 [Sedimentisphaerales bacterium]|jgi:hypothetical protein